MGLFLITLSCIKNNGNEIKKADKELAKTNNLIEDFSGVLPCADCEGIKTDLKIFDNETFELNETYTGKNNSVLKQKGKLLIERGFENDIDATLYTLNPDKPNEKLYFVYFSNNPKGEILKLDNEKKIIDSKLNYKLVRK